MLKDKFSLSSKPWKILRFCNLQQVHVIVYCYCSAKRNGPIIQAFVFQTYILDVYGSNCGRAQAILTDMCRELSHYLPGNLIQYLDWPTTASSSTLSDSSLTHHATISASVCVINRVAKETPTKTSHTSRDKQGVLMNAFPSRAGNLLTGCGISSFSRTTLVRIQTLFLC